MLRLSGASSTSSAAGTMRLKRLIKPPDQPVVLDFNSVEKCTLKLLLMCKFCTGKESNSKDGCLRIIAHFELKCH